MGGEILRCRLAEQIRHLHGHRIPDEHINIVHVLALLVGICWRGDDVCGHLFDVAHKVFECKRHQRVLLPLEERNADAKDGLHALGEKYIPDAQQEIEGEIVRHEREEVLFCGSTWTYTEGYFIWGEGMVVERKFEY